MQSDIQQLVFSYCIAEQKIYYPDAAITWAETLSNSIRTGWFPGIAASWWRVPKLRYETMMMAAASTNQTVILAQLHAIGAPFLQKHLMRAAQCGHVDAFRAIVPHVQDRNTEFALCTAVMHQHTHLVKLIHVMFPDVPLHNAFCEAKTWQMRVLICSFGYTPNNVKTIDISLINFCLCMGGLDTAASINYAAKTGALVVIKLLKPTNFDTVLTAGIAHNLVAKYALAHRAVITEQIIIHATAINTVAGLSLMQPMYCGSYDTAFCSAAYYGARDALVWLHNTGVHMYHRAMYNAAKGKNRGLMRLIRYWNPNDYVVELAAILMEHNGDPEYARVISIMQLW